MRDTTFEVSRRWYRVAGLFVVLVFVWNLHTIRVLPASSYHAMTPVFRVLRIDQLWNMFAPYPLKEDGWWRSEEHTSELQSLMRISYAVFCLKKKKRIFSK